MQFHSSEGHLISTRSKFIRHSLERTRRNKQIQYIGVLGFWGFGVLGSNFFFFFFFFFFFASYFVRVTYVPISWMSVESSQRASSRICIHKNASKDELSSSLSHSLKAEQCSTWYPASNSWSTPVLWGLPPQRLVSNNQSRHDLRHIHSR